MFLFKEKEKKHILTFAIWIEYLGQPLIIYIYIYVVFGGQMRRNNIQGLVWWVRRILHDQPTLVFMV